MQHFKRYGNVNTKIQKRKHVIEDGKVEVVVFGYFTRKFRNTIFTRIWEIKMYYSMDIA